MYGTACPSSSPPPLALILLPPFVVPSFIERLMARYGRCILREKGVCVWSDFDHDRTQCLASFPLLVLVSMRRAFSRCDRSLKSSSEADSSEQSIGTAGPGQIRTHCSSGIKPDSNYASRGSLANAWNCAPIEFYIRD
jgi:hypothetical protein